MTVHRRLPLLVEQSVSKVQALRIDLSSKFDAKVRMDALASGTPITCQPGCAWCCHHPVTISILEGIIIYRHLLNTGQWSTRLKDKLRAVSDDQYGTSFQVWLLALIPCPLLDEDNKCRAYAARPLICRSYYATSDPHYCHPHRLGGDTSIVDREVVVEQFHMAQEKVLRSHKLQLLTMPIGSAVLFAEKVCEGEVDIETIDAYLLKEYAEKG